MEFFGRFVNIRFDSSQLAVLPNDVMQPRALPVDRFEIIARFMEYRIQLRQNSVIQRGEHVMQAMIPETGQHGKVRSFDIGPVNHSCYLVHAKVDFVSADRVRTT